MDSKQKQPQEKQPQEKQLQFEQQADPGQPPQQPTQGPYLPQGPSTPWINKLCFKPYEDWDTCCLGLWLPCVLYGRTQTRLEKIYLGEDPLNESQLPKRNRYCCAWYSTFVFVKSSCKFSSHPQFGCADHADTIYQGFVPLRSTVEFAIHTTLRAA